MNQAKPRDETTLVSLYDKTVRINPLSVIFL